jgi:hypothetical protein
MSEIINYLPEVATAVGYGAGQVADIVAAKYAAQRGEAVVEAWGPLNEQADQPAHEASKRFSDRVNRMVAPLALVGAFAAGSGAIAWSPQTAHKTTSSVLEEVVDHSFQTGQDGSYKNINTIAGGFATAKTLKLRAIVAHNGGYDAIQISQLPADTPYGPASVESALAVAMSDAFNSSAPGQSNVLGTGEKRSAGLLVLTDDNPIGNVDTIVTMAKEDGNLPVFVANAGDSNTQTAKDLQTIAKRTGGQYWNAKSGTPSVASNIESHITPHEVAEPVSNDSENWLKVLNIISVLAAGVMIRRRAEILFSRRQKLNA